MINVLIPITDRIEKYQEIIKALEDSENITVYLMAGEKLYPRLVEEYSQFENFEMFCFENGATKEEMINSVQNYIGKGSLMVLRKPVTVKEFNKMVSSEKDVVTGKVVKNKFKTFIFRLWQKLTKLVIGVKMYSGDPSVVYFNEDLADVALRTSNLSYSTRVNRWKGASQAVATIEAPSEKKQIDKKTTIRNSIIASLIVVIGVAATVLVALYAPITITSVLLLICLNGVCVGVAALLVIMAIFTNMTGSKNVKYAMILKKSKNYFEGE